MAQTQLETQGRADNFSPRVQDDLEMMNDEAIILLRTKMLTACDNDIEENEAGRFAIHKLRMLPEVVGLMRK